MDRTLPEIFGIAMGIAFLAGVFALAVEILVVCLMKIRRDVIGWWESRKVPAGWQPKPIWKRKGIRWSR